MRQIIEGIVAGGAWLMDVELKNPDGTPIDLTGSTVFFVIKAREDDEDELVYKKITSHTDADAGLTRISLTEEDTAELQPGHDHVGQIRVKDSGGVVTPWDVMTVNVSKLLSSRED